MHIAVHFPKNIAQMTTTPAPRKRIESTGTENMARIRCRFIAIALTPAEE
jgi:hypothetical protein